jgi:hypothetical protein
MITLSVKHPLASRSSVQELVKKAFEETFDLTHPPLVSVGGIAFSTAMNQSQPQPQRQKAHQYRPCP